MNDLTAQEQPKEQRLTANNSVAKPSFGTPFPKGTSGNPSGRPKGAKSLTTLLRDALKEREKKTGVPYEELLVNRLMDLAISKGDMRALKLIYERLEGLPKQEIGIESSGGLGIVILPSKEEAKPKEVHGD